LLENDYIEAIIALPTDLFYNTGIATYIWVLSMNKRAERKGKIQLIDASAICHKLRKPLGNKKNEIGPEERKAITDLYVNFEENDLCKIYPNTEFMYREYAVMQPLQRSYAINDERIEQMLLSGALNSLYDAVKVTEIEEKEVPTDKELKKAEEYKKNEPVYKQVIAALHAAKSEKVYLSLQAFEPVLAAALAQVVIPTNKIVSAIAEGLSVMDKSAEIQRDKKGNIIYDKDTKDIEIVRFDEDIDTYMQREVLPHIPDAVGRATPSRWSRTRRVCFGGMRSDGEKDGSDPILTHRHFAERLDGTGKM
jgi:type I restriction enzyme M protein